MDTQTGHRFIVSRARVRLGERSCARASVRLTGRLDTAAHVQ